MSVWNDIGWTVPLNQHHQGWSWSLMQYLISCSFFSHGSQTFKSAHWITAIQKTRRWACSFIHKTHVVVMLSARVVHMCTCTHSWCFAFSSGSSDSSCWCVRHSVFMCDLTHFLFCLWTLKQTNTQTRQHFNTHSLSLTHVKHTLFLSLSSLTLAQKLLYTLRWYSL